MTSPATTRTAPAGRIPELTEADVADGPLPRLHTIVVRDPHAIAAADGAHRVSYAQLARQAGLVRAAVRSVPGTSAVGLLHGHDARAVGAMLGVLASGRPLVVLDPRSPAPRLRQLLARARAGVCVTDAGHAELAARVAPRVVINERLVPTADDIDQLWSAPPDPSRPALLAFTSGTTGRPKMIANDHRMIVRDALAVAGGCYRPGDVVAHTLPMAFHAGLLAALAGVLIGARLQFHDVRAAGVASLGPWLASSGATVAQLSPGTVRSLLALRPDPEQFANLRAVTVTGEPFHGRQAAALRSLLGPDCVLHNRYGSSETGLISDHPLPPDADLPAGPLPVGRPVAGLRVSVLDDAGAPVPEGGTGVVAVTGRHLGSGYWDDPQASAAVFTEHADGTVTFRSNDLGRLDPDGRLHLLGRRDFQVRIGEELVDPDDVDAALHDLPEVCEAVTVGAPDPDTEGGHRLVSYVVPERPDALDPEAVQDRLRDVLPGTMVPRVVVLLDALPTTDRGKIDRAALPPPE